MNPSGIAAPTAEEAREQIETLVGYEAARRNDAWRMAFFENLRVAGPYALRTVAAKESPNGFPYHVIIVQEIGRANATLWFDDVLDRALSAGAGLAVYAALGARSPEFLASFGDLVGVRAWGHLIITRRQSAVEVPTSAEAIEFEVTSPLEVGLPDLVLRRIAAHMRAQLGVRVPKLLSARQRGQIGWDLVVDLDRQAFGDESCFLDALSSIKWFVPAETAVMANPFASDAPVPWFICEEA